MSTVEELLKLMIEHGKLQQIMRPASDSDLFNGKYLTTWKLKMEAILENVDLKLTRNATAENARIHAWNQVLVE